MELSIALYFSLLLHFVGDYPFQNDKLAKLKTENTFACLIHVFIYSFGFWWLLNFDYQYCLIVSVSHFFIDRFRLAVYWIKLVNWNWNSENFGYENNKPQFMSTWLMIIIDNTFHVLFNTLAIWLKYN